LASPEWSPRDSAGHKERELTVLSDEAVEVLNMMIAVSKMSATELKAKVNTKDSRQTAV